MTLGSCAPAVLASQNTTWLIGYVKMRFDRVISESDASSLQEFMVGLDPPVMDRHD